MTEHSPEMCPETPPPWASYGATAEDEDFIVGSPAGLRVLREYIDKAIQDGESLIAEPGIQFNGVRCKGSPTDVPSESWLSSLAGYGCFAVILTVIALAIYGAIALFR